MRIIQIMEDFFFIRDNRGKTQGIFPAKNTPYHCYNTLPGIDAQ